MKNLQKMKNLPKRRTRTQRKPKTAEALKMREMCRTQMREEEPWEMAYSNLPLLHPLRREQEALPRSAVALNLAAVFPRAGIDVLFERREEKGRVHWQMFLMF